jgi:hypothetical protein
MIWKAVTLFYELTWVGLGIQWEGLENPHSAIAFA